MTSKKCLRARIGGTDRAFHLQTNDITTHEIRVRTGGSDLYCPLASGTASNCINVRVGGADYHTVDYTPTLRFTYTAGWDSQPYINPYYFSYLKIAMLNSVTINNPVYLYLEVGAQSQSWVNVLTLTAGGVSAEQSYSYSNGYRFGSSGYKGYIKIGNWTSSTFWIDNSGTHNVDIAIPEAQWGV